MSDRLDQELRRMMRAVERADRRAEAHREQSEQHQRRDFKQRRDDRLRSPTEQLLRGGVMLAAAGVLAVMGLTTSPWWFLWVALSLALSGASQLARGLGRRAEEKAASEVEGAVVAKSEAPAEPVMPARAQVKSAGDPELARVEEIARKLLHELQTGPAVLREIVQRPKETIEGLERGYRALLERERALRAGGSAEEIARLEAERISLVARIEATSDAPTRSGFQQALSALETQRQEVAAMATAAGRMEAERTRLRLTLESLHAQVIRTRAMHGTGAEGTHELREGLARLSDEVGAVAEALDATAEVDPLSPVSPMAGVSPEPMDSEPGGDPAKTRVR